MKSTLSATKALMGAAVATAATLSVAVASSPVQAAQLAPGSSLSVTQLDFGLGASVAGVDVSSSRLNFYGPSGLGTGFDNGSLSPGGAVVQSTTGSFQAYTLGVGLVKDLSRPNPTASQRSNFLRFAALNAGTNPFSISAFAGSFSITNNPGGFSVTSSGNQNFAASFNGFFNVSGFDQTFGIGTITTQANSGETRYVINLTAVPTPALLPGLIGFGVAAIRKRKSEASAQAETQV